MYEPDYKYYNYETRADGSWVVGVFLKNNNTHAVVKKVDPWNTGETYQYFYCEYGENPSSTYIGDTIQWESGKEGDGAFNVF